MSRRLAISTITTACVAAPASAGMLTMTADAASGADAWASYQDYSLVLTIDCSDLSTAGSAGSFTLQGWDFQAFDTDGALVLAAAGTQSSFSASGSGPIFTANISLDSGTITTNDLDPAADYLAFSYDFGAATSLGDAIAASALLNVGTLSIGTNLGGGGDLMGFYSVPAPSAVALLGLVGVAARRRRHASAHHA